MVVSGFLGKAWRGLGRKREGRQRDIYVGQGREQRKKKLVGTVAVLLLGLLGLSMGFGIVKQRTSDEAKALREVQERVEQKLAESEKLEELNPLRARALVVEAEELLGDYSDLGVPKRAKGWYEKASGEVLGRTTSLLKIYETTEVELFLDLELVREGTRGKGLDFDGEQVMVMDTDSDVVLAIDVKSKEAGVVGGGDLLRGSKVAAIYFGKGFVLSSKGVVELDLNRKTSAVVIFALNRIIFS